MSTINKIFDIWFKDNVIVKFLQKSFIALIFIRVSIKWNNIRFIYNIIIVIIINYTLDHNNIKIKKSNLIKNFNINNNDYFTNI